MTENGFEIETELPLLSIIVLPCSVNKDVPLTAVNGADGGVNAAVYTAVPFTTRKFDSAAARREFPGTISLVPIYQVPLVVV